MSGRMYVCTWCVWARAWRCQLTGRAYARVASPPRHVGDPGTQRAAASLPFIKELNPLASADAVQTPLDSQTNEFWGAFTLVILSGQVPSSLQVGVPPCAYHLAQGA